ncbi:hypothetical protein JCM11641_002016 [Rhodosporidiobolus odoratus]
MPPEPPSLTTRRNSSWDHNAPEPAEERSNLVGVASTTLIHSYYVVMHLATFYGSDDPQQMAQRLHGGVYGLDMALRALRRSYWETVEQRRDLFTTVRWLIKAVKVCRYQPESAAAAPKSTPARAPLPDSQRNRTEPAQNRPPSIDAHPRPTATAVQTDLGPLLPRRPYRIAFHPDDLELSTWFDNSRSLKPPSNHPRRHGNPVLDLRISSWLIYSEKHTYTCNEPGGRLLYRNSTSPASEPIPVAGQPICVLEPKAFLESDGSNRVWSGKKALEWIIAHEERTLEAWETVAPGMKRSMDRYGNLDHQELSLTFAVYHVANWDTAPLFEIMEAQENKGKKREEREGEPIRPRVKGENEESQLAAGSSSKKRQVEDEGDRLHPDERFKEVTMRGPVRTPSLDPFSAGDQR